jgi:DNA-directed RNA polymerase specialized sigma24 family protein
MDRNRNSEYNRDRTRQEGLPDRSVALLRKSTGGGALTVSESEIVRDLLNRLNHSLLGCCANLLRNGYLTGTIEPEDIVQASWTKVLQYLKNRSGEPVETELHLWRLLRVVAKQVYLDLLDREAKSPIVESSTLMERGDAEEGQTPVAQWEESLPDTVRFAGDNRYSSLIELLFRDEDGFRSRCRGKARRRPELYRAYVVYQMVVYLRAEAYGERNGVSSVDAGFARAMDEYREMLGVPNEVWEPLEKAVQQPQDGRSDAEVAAGLLQQVHEVFAVRLDTGNLMSVLRYELKSCAYE